MGGKEKCVLMNVCSTDAAGKGTELVAGLVDAGPTAKDQAVRGRLITALENCGMKQLLALTCVFSICNGALLWNVQQMAVNAGIGCDNM